MKTLFSLFIATLICFTTFAKLPEERSYIITKTDTIFCQSVITGSFLTSCILDDGKVLCIDNRDVIRFQNNLQVYEPKVIFLDKNTSMFCGFCKVENTSNNENSAQSLSGNRPEKAKIWISNKDNSSYRKMTCYIDPVK